MVVSNFAGAVLISRVCVMGVTRVVQQRIFLIEFIMLSMREFDNMFGMDWMTRHRALMLLKLNVQIIFQGRGRYRGG